MPTPITKYLCNLCKTEHLSEKRAQVCEDLGEAPETKHIKVGDTISFTRDVAREITREVKSYITSEGKILAKEVKLNTMTNAHQDLFIVQTSDEQGEYEGLAAMINVNGKNEMFMAASPRYKLGFAESMKQK